MNSALKYFKYVIRNMSSAVIEKTHVKYIQTPPPPPPHPHMPLEDKLKVARLRTH